MTIKYNTDSAGNIKIITKDGKVSCTCCEAGECCMYPAQALADGLYTVDDLPDSITAIVEEIEANMDRSGSVFYSTEQFGTIPAGNSRIILYSDPIESQWRSEYFDGSGWFPFDFFGSSNCLIGDYGQGGTVEDQFADTYAISGPISGTVTRESICVWRGSNLRLTNFGYQWIVNGNNKTGNQNTPVGSYAGGYSVS
jgi:hypothetical protein